MTDKQRAVQALREKQECVTRVAVYHDVALYELVATGKRGKCENGWVAERCFQLCIGYKLRMGTLVTAYELLHQKPNYKLDLESKMDRGRFLAGQAIQRALKATGSIETRRNDGGIEIRAIDQTMERPVRTIFTEDFFHDQLRAERRSERAKKGAATRKKNREEQLDEVERLKALAILDQLQNVGRACK